jgi:hypothetical protein
MVTTGAVLINVPLAVGAGAAAFVVGVLLGALAFYLGLAGATERRGGLTDRAMADLDWGVAIGLVVAAMAFAAVDELVATALFGPAALVALTVAAFARPTATPAT